MKKIDLHGIRHNEAQRYIREIALDTQPPFIIVTGHSKKMIAIVVEQLDQLGVKYQDDYMAGIVYVL